MPDSWQALICSVKAADHGGLCDRAQSQHIGCSAKWQLLRCVHVPNPLKRISHFAVEPPVDLLLLPSEGLLVLHPLEEAHYHAACAHANTDSAGQISVSCASLPQNHKALASTWVMQSVNASRVQALAHAHKSNQPSCFLNKGLQDKTPERLQARASAESQMQAFMPGHCLEMHSSCTAKIHRCKLQWEWLQLKDPGRFDKPALTWPDCINKLVMP